MILGVFDRFQVINVLPTEGNFVTLTLLQSIRDEMFGPADLEPAGIQQKPNGDLSWDGVKDVQKEVTLEKAARELIAQRLRSLDDQHKLTAAYMTIYRLFVIDPSLPVNRLTESAKELQPANGVKD